MQCIISPLQYTGPIDQPVIGGPLTLKLIELHTIRYYGLCPPTRPTRIARVIAAETTLIQQIIKSISSENIPPSPAAHAARHREVLRLHHDIRSLPPASNVVEFPVEDLRVPHQRSRILELLLPSLRLAKCHAHLAQVLLQRLQMLLDLHARALKAVCDVFDACDVARHPRPVCCDGRAAVFRRCGREQ